MTNDLIWLYIDLLKNNSSVAEVINKSVYHTWILFENFPSDDVGFQFPVYTYAQPVGGGWLDLYSDKRFNVDWCHQSSSSTEMRSSSSSSSSSTIRFTSSSSSNSSSSSTWIRSSSSTFLKTSSSTSSSSSRIIYDLNVLLPPGGGFDQIIRWAKITNWTGVTCKLVTITPAGADDGIYAAIGNFMNSQSLRNPAYWTGVGFGGVPANWTMMASVPAGSDVTLGLYNYGGGGACGGFIDWAPV